MLKLKYLLILIILTSCLSACSKLNSAEQAGENTEAAESEANKRILEIQAEARELADDEKEMAEYGDISRAETLWGEAMAFVTDNPDYFESDESIESAILYGYYIEYINEEYSDVDDVPNRYHAWRIGKNLAEVASKVYADEISDSAIEDYLAKIQDDLASIYGEN